MKKIYWAIISVFAFGSCEPVVDDKPMGRIVGEADLDLKVYATTEGGNEIVMENNTVGVGSYWDHITGISTKQKAVVVLPFMGEQVITFTGFCDGGKVTTTRSVNITQIDHEVAKEWRLLAGDEIKGKSWTWNFEAYNGAVYGTAGWLTQFAPAWDVKPVDALEDKDCTLVFDLNGGPNLSKVDVDGNVLEKGTFSFDMSVIKKNPDNGSQWSIGQLKISGVSILSGHAFYNANDVTTSFEILELTDETMVLCGTMDAEAWMDATFWCFKRK